MKKRVIESLESLIKDATEPDTILEQWSQFFGGPYHNQEEVGEVTFVKSNIKQHGIRRLKHHRLLIALQSHNLL